MLINITAYNISAPYYKNKSLHFFKLFKQQQKIYDSFIKEVSLNPTHIKAGVIDLSI